VDAGRDRATPTSVRLDADEEVDSRGAMCTLDYRVATNRHGSHTIKCGTPTPKYLPPKWTGVVGLAAGCFSIRVEITKTTIGNGMWHQTRGLVEESRFLYKAIFCVFYTRFE